MPFFLAKPGCLMVALRHTISGWVLLFLLCLGSRLCSTTFYIADPDSLRFFLSATDYNLAKLQPHFPGYAVFCAFLKAIFFFTGNQAVSFSIIGGIATFLLIWPVLKIKKHAPVLEKGLLAVLLFLNPMIWCLGNRYMPDLLGTSFVYLTFLAFYNRDQRAAKYIFCVAVGLLAGIRLSYIPMVLIPLFVFFYDKRNWPFAAILLLSVFVWLVPMVLDCTLPGIIMLGKSHTEGHFVQWGGTIISEPSASQRITRVFQFIWAHGLGGFWQGRHWSVLLYSIFLCLLFIAGIVQGLKSIRRESNTTLTVLWLSGFIYFVWIFFFQNIVHQSRHVLPLIPLLLMSIAKGAGWFSKLNKPATVAFLVVFCGLNLAITLVLVKQHRQATAIAQITNFLQKSRLQNRNIVSIDMILYFLKEQHVAGTFISIEQEKEKASKMLRAGEPTIVIGDFREFHNIRPDSASTYFHNPYINSLWPEVTVYYYAPCNR